MNQPARGWCLGWGCLWDRFWGWSSGLLNKYSSQHHSKVMIPKEDNRILPIGRLLIFLSPSRKNNVKRSWPNIGETSLASSLANSRWNIITCCWVSLSIVISIRNYYCWWLCTVIYEQHIMNAYQQLCSWFISTFQIVNRQFNNLEFTINNHDLPWVAILTHDDPLSAMIITAFFGDLPLHHRLTILDFGQRLLLWN